ncbi:MAG: ABC transporter permease [Candidatus Desulfofervidaceae bacterium]|nr:ABC transporter permease [Candidatus Desulfofervidaceae bacterium]
MRDPPSLIQTLLLPAVLLLLYGYALNFDLTHVPFAVYNRDQTLETRQLLDYFAHSRYFHLVGQVNDYDTIKRLFWRGKIHLALVIPYGFSAHLKKGNPLPLQAIIDGTDANVGNTILTYVKAVVAQYNDDLMKEQFMRLGHSQAELPLKAELRIWFNEEMESRNFIIPGLIVVIITMVGATLTALTIVKEAEWGSLERVMSTPVEKIELILGKLTPYFFLGLIDLLIIMGVGSFLFHVPMRGNPLLLIFLSVLFLIGVLFMGLWISVVAKTQMQANQMAILLTFLPALLLSGFVFPIHNMPKVLQIIAYLLPATYFVIITKGVYLKGLGLKALWPETLVLLAFAIFFFSLVIRKFEKRLK